MPLTYFFTYIGLFLAGSVTLSVVVVKQFAEGFAAHGKKPYLYGFISSTVASGTAYLATWIEGSIFLIFWILAAIYLVFGIIHMVMVHKKYFQSGKQDKTRVIIAEVVFGLSIIFFTIVVFSSLRYFIDEKDTSYLFYPLLMSTITFFIPFLFMQTFEAAYNIPAAVFKTWQYPLHTQIDVPDLKPGERELVIGFEIAKKQSDEKKAYFRAKAPEMMILGEFYYHFINDYNDAQSETPIEYVDEGNEPHQWWFRRKSKWYQQEKILDPEITVRENGIKENTVIICERI